MKFRTNMSGLKAALVSTGQGYQTYPAGTFGGNTGRAIMPLNGLTSSNSMLIYGFLPQMLGSSPTTIAYSKGLFFFKGAMPTQAELDTWVSTAGDVTADSGIFRYSDLLIKYAPSGGNFANGSLVTTFNPTVATGTGAASWYAFGAFQCTSNGTPKPTNLIIGTITSIGGGGDIELLNTSINTGTTYRVPQYEMRLPSKFSS